MSVEENGARRGEGAVDSRAITRMPTSIHSTGMPRPARVLISAPLVTEHAMLTAERQPPASWWTKPCVL
jgi:hypothetical protein